MASLEEKMEQNTQELVTHRKALEANTAALLGGKSAGAKSASTEADADEEKPKRGRKPAKAAEPEHDKDEVDAIIRKVSKEVGKPAAKAIIASFKCDDLADLLTNPQHFDAAFAKAEEALAEEPEAEEDEDI